MKKRFPDEVDRILRSCGWTGILKDQIDLKLPPQFKIFPAAEKALKEFGGLYYKPDSIRGNEFGRAEFKITPGDFTRSTYLFEEEERGIGKKLYPIGEALNYPIDLLIADDGTPYSHSEYGIFQDGDTFDDTLISLILGMRPSPNYTLYPVFNSLATPDHPPIARYEHLIEKPLLPDRREE